MNFDRHTNKQTEITSLYIETLAVPIRTQLQWY